MAGLIGKKLEMTRIIKENVFIPVTLIEIPDNTVNQIKDIDKDGHLPDLGKNLFLSMLFWTFFC